ncbi:MAG: MltA domain-containing protein [Rhizobiales bacterium]|nr:MltA domain-containing protein [Hyphomicrobiales bacterium]
MDVVSRPGFDLVPVAFADIPGWAGDDHGAAFAAFRRGAAVLADHPPKPRSSGLDADRLAAIIRRAGEKPAALSPAAARDFFETHFAPHEVRPADGTAFFTGYYEPVVAGSRTRTERFSTPLYRPPPNLVEIDPDRPPPGIEPGFRFALSTPGGLVPCHDRGAIQDGALDGAGLEIAWLADPVDAFFIHVQGAARLRLEGGGEMRVTYAAKSGHPYTAIARELIAMGALTRAEATMQGLRAWLAAHPEAVPGVLARNRSFIFFREAPVEDPALGPVAAAKVPLTPGRSLAVDRLIHSFGAPVFVAAALADGQPWQRLMIAQDTGSAIVGAARGDIFTGSGDAAGVLAGPLQSRGRFILFWPREAP